MDVDFTTPDSKSNIKLVSVNSTSKKSDANPDVRYFQIHFEQIQTQLRELQDLAEKIQFEMREAKHPSSDKPMDS